MRCVAHGPSPPMARGGGRGEGGASRGVHEASPRAHLPSAACSLGPGPGSATYQWLVSAVSICCTCQALLSLRRDGRAPWGMVRSAIACNWHRLDRQQTL